MSRNTRVLALLLGALAIAAPASAQWTGTSAWLEDRQARQGPGFRIGNLELHPGVGVEVGYDTNVFLEETDPLGSVLFRISPHIDISTLTSRATDGDSHDDGEVTPPTVTFNAGLGGSLYIFLADEARNDVAINANFELNVLPQRPFGFTIYSQYNRRIRAFSDQRGANYANNTNDAGLRLNFASRGGIVTGSVGYSFRFNLFEGTSAEEGDFRFANNFTHRGSATFNWQFLPSTALVYELTVDHTTYQNEATTGTSDVPLALLTNNNTRLRSLVGVNGALTPKISFLAALGYGAAFMTDDVRDGEELRLREFDTLLARAELRFRPTVTTNIAVGYERDFLGSLLGNWRVRDRGYLRFNWLIGRSFMLGTHLWLAHLKFGTLLAPDGSVLGTEEDRTDIVAAANIFAEYRFTDYLGLNATVSYTGNFTDFQYIGSPVGGGAMGLDPANFNKFEAFLGVRLFY